MNNIQNDDNDNDNDNNFHVLSVHEIKIAEEHAIRFGLASLLRVCKSHEKLRKQLKQQILEEEQIGK